MPSSTAARVAFSASVMRSFFSPTSTSEEPPTLITATPPESLARRSLSFSFSYSLVVFSICARIMSQRSLMASLLPAPSSTRVSSLEMVTLPAVPKWSSVVVSSFIPTSSEITTPPVNSAMSCRLALRLSPKPGALTAHTLICARRRLMTRPVRASLSTSSAMMSKGLFSRMAASRMWTMACMDDTFFSTSRMYGFSNSTFCVAGLVTKYGEMKPRSKRMPSTTSSSSSSVRPSCTVITPSLPTFSMPLAMRPPMSASLFAEMVATWAISSVEVMGVDLEARKSTTWDTAASMPRFRSMGFMPAATALTPSL
mmetsp:Transcript_139784/g.197964  ORF Transcript_139784/g.197964 Transcript_139784/m.197964 type:complete len:312 (-) Transcript_139784:351-1286(-)